MSFLFWCANAPDLNDSMRQSGGLSHDAGLDRIDTLIVLLREKNDVTNLAGILIFLSAKTGHPLAASWMAATP